MTLTARHTRIYSSAPHGLPITGQDQLTFDLLELICG